MGFDELNAMQKKTELSAKYRLWKKSRITSQKGQKS